jgi:hypothetical protein
MIDQKENSAHLISDQSCHNFIRRFLLGFTENKYCRHTSSFRAKFGPIPRNIASKVRELFTSTKSCKRSSVDFQPFSIQDANAIVPV